MNENDIYHQAFFTQENKIKKILLIKITNKIVHLGNHIQ